MKKETKNFIGNLILFLIILSLFLFILSHAINKILEEEKILKQCQEKGWDGIEFKSTFPKEIICANLTQAEKDAKLDTDIDKDSKEAETIKNVFGNFTTPLKRN